MRSPALLALAALAAVTALTVSACGGDDPRPAPTPVAEAPSAPPPPTYLLEKERDFTWADTAYGKCLTDHGVEDLPALAERLALDTGSPETAAALTACATLSPAPSPS
ncbi:hypothetical protein EDD29_4436 [Actinocorallia herbida]|uniref:Uncharacterized protein n=1 Tax=Actinocorallia herbida TaxID=58109 RepID=A0A3N1D001_9ACTN|nr:hypothetical protein [Actinocorallia herbida]ROO86854.1 hypothetical protein EDD29_4436 [Actinocorallia herbida]